MKRALCITAICLFFSPAFATAADPKVEDLLGKWELTAEAAGIPKGATFDFRKGGKLIVTAKVGDEEKVFDFGFDIKGKLLELEVGGKKDTTGIEKLTETELVCKDNDGTTAKFKRVSYLLGKWELTAEAAGIPKGAIFDFQKDGKLIVTATIGGEKKTFNFEFNEKGKTLEIIIEGKKDTTGIEKLNHEELVCKDNDGTMAKFKRVTK
jgi:uncharacterized protein (TIGR03066 family)